MLRRATLLAMGLAILTLATAGAQQPIPQTEATLQLSDDEQVEFLKAHNDARRAVGLPPLTWSEKLASYAEEWVTANYEGYRKDALAGLAPGIKSRPEAQAGKNNKLAQKYGENIACWNAGDVPTDAVQAVLGRVLPNGGREGGWLAEKAAFDKLNANKSYVVGSEAGKKDESGNPIQVLHYTQMVWKNTRQCGAAKWSLKYTDKNGVTRRAAVIVCNYDPPGNVTGQKPY